MTPLNSPLLRNSLLSCISLPSFSLSFPTLIILENRYAAAIPAILIPTLMIVATKISRKHKLM